jgi:hypothetical protein
MMCGHKSDEMPRETQLETAKLTLAANEYDLDREEGRMRTVDEKLTLLASSSGVALSIVASLGGSIVAAGRLSAGFTIALGACLCVAVALLFAGVGLAFAALFPKPYEGATTKAILKRAQAGPLGRDPVVAAASFALTRAEMVKTARKVNKRKANALRKVFVLVASGFFAIAAAVAVVSVGSSV